jgi:hypothetical protein
LKIKGFWYKSVPDKRGKSMIYLKLFACEFVMKIVGKMLDVLNGAGMGRSRLYALADIPYDRAWNIRYDIFQVMKDKIRDSEAI